MKKYLAVLVLATVVTPSVALASWWNPLSWSIFHRDDAKNQVTKMKSSESQKKLDAAVSSTDDASIVPATKVASTTTRVIKKGVANAVEKQKKEVVQDIKVEIPKKEVRTFTLPTGAVVDIDGNVLNADEMERRSQENLAIENLKIQQQVLELKNKEMEQKLLEITSAQIKAEEDAQRQAQIRAIRLERDNLVRPLNDEIYSLQSKIRNASSYVTTVPSYNYSIRVEQFKIDTQKQIDDYIVQINTLEAKYNAEIVKLGGLIIRGIDYERPITN